jgi:hypothetical protein
MTARRCQSVVADADRAYAWGAVALIRLERVRYNHAMCPEDTTTEATHQRPVDPGFELDSSYRRRLTDLGQAQYDAARRGNRSRVDRIRSRLVEDSPVGAGVGRVVYPLPETAYTAGHYEGYVLKLPVPDSHDRYGYNRDGRTQNRSETRLWDQYHTRWLVPVVAAERRGRWLVMPRGQPVGSDPDWLEAWTREFVDAHELGSVHGHDVQAQNLVRLDGRPRLCDYGVLAE